MAICLTIACVYNLRNNATGDGLTTSPWFIVLTSIGALFGVVSTILAANANILTFVFGLIDVVIFSFSLFLANPRPIMLLALHVGYFIPMEFIGFFQWRRRGATSSGQTLRARRLKGLQWLWTILSFFGVFVVVCIIRWLIDSGTLANVLGWEFLLSAIQPLDYRDIALDSVMTTSNIVALILMAMAFTDQWYLWVLVNISSIVAFALKMSTGGAESGYFVALFLKYVFYLLNSLNAIRIWLKLSAKEETLA